MSTYYIFKAVIPNWTWTQQCIYIICIHQTAPCHQMTIWFQPELRSKTLEKITEAILSWYQLYSTLTWVSNTRKHTFISATCRAGGGGVVVAVVCLEFCLFSKSSYSETERSSSQLLTLADLSCSTQSVLVPTPDNPKCPCAHTWQPKVSLCPHLTTQSVLVPTPDNPKCPCAHTWQPKVSLCPHLTTQSILVPTPDNPKCPCAHTWQPKVSLCPDLTTQSVLVPRSDNPKCPCAQIWQPNVSLCPDLTTPSLTKSLVSSWYTSSWSWLSRSLHWKKKRKIRVHHDLQLTQYFYGNTTHPILWKHTN